MRQPVRIALALALVSALAAAIVAAGAARDTRAWLDFSFGGIPDSASETLSIFGNNLRMLAAVFAACVVAQLACKPLVWVCDVAVAASAIGQAALVGAGIGAYGDRLVAFLLPHGPLELVAYSTALALYVEARRERVTAGRWALSAAVALAALAIAAPLEVYLTPAG